MKSYLDLLRNVTENGVHRINRTDVGDRFIPAGMITADLRNGFPAVTTKQLFYKQSIGEILGFIRGLESAAEFRLLGCRIWDSDANENAQWLSSPYRTGRDDLGKVYGAVWRDRTVYKSVPLDDEHAKIGDYLEHAGYALVGDGASDIYSKSVDQLYDVVDAILHRPNDRRIIMHAWFPELFDEMALPPCHCMYRFVPDAVNRVLHMTMYQRSSDVFLGVPFNLFGSAMLLSLIARATGYTPGVFSHMLSDVHLYDNAADACAEQLSRSPMQPPELVIHRRPPSLTAASDSDRVTRVMHWLESVEPTDLELTGYTHRGTLTPVKMAQCTG